MNGDDGRGEMGSRRTLSNGGCGNRRKTNFALTFKCNNKSIEVGRGGKKDERELQKRSKRMKVN